MKYIVYLTTNTQSKINGINKIYVGVHKTENPDIFDGYIGCGCYTNKPSTYMYPKTPFQCAVKKYGSAAFKRIILHIFDTAKEAYDMEASIVTTSFIKESHTYNVAIGGIGGSLYIQLPEWHSKPLYQFNKEGELVKKWESTLEASEFYSEYYSRFDWAIADHYLFLDSYWARTDTIDVKLYSNSHKGYTYLYNKDGKLVAEFPSRTSCAKALGCTPQSVSKAIKTSSILKNCYPSDILTDCFEVKPRVALKDAEIFIYNVNGEFVGKGIGKEIMNIIQLHSYKSIWSAIYSNNGWYKDYYLSLTEVDKVPSKLHNNHKCVDVYDKYGNFIETLNSLKDVKEKYSINSAELNRVLKGIKQHKQYIFKYSSK